MEPSESCFKRTGWKEEKENCEAIQIQMKGEKSKEKLDDVWEKVKEIIYLRQVCQHAEQRMGKKWKEETILNV